MQIDPGSFIVQGGSLLRAVGSTPEVIRLKCTGTSSNKITLTFNYEDGGAGTSGNFNQSINTITIDVMQASSDSSSTPTDTKKIRT